MAYGSIETQNKKHAETQDEGSGKSLTQRKKKAAPKSHQILEVSSGKKLVGERPKERRASMEKVRGR